MVLRICKHCGKEFNTYPSRIKIGSGKYCSRECYYNGREYLKGEKNPQYKREIRICKYCGKEFEVKPNRKKIFCSPKCFGEWHKGINHKQYKDRTERTCPICNNNFYVRPSKIKQKYCSKKCSNLGKLGHKPYNKTGKFVNCPICGKIFYARQGRLQGNYYCSKECSDIGKKRLTGINHPLYSQIEIICDNCGKKYFEKPSIIKKYKHHFCSKRCNGIYQVLHQSNPSNVEKRLAKYLIENKISFTDQFKYKLGVADFFIKPNIIIEVDGDYWHNLPKVKIRDEKQTKYLKAEGYSVLHFWEHDINNNIKNCLKKIKNVMN